MSKLPISFEDVLAAAKRIKDGIYHTPAEFSEVLSEAVGSEIFLKFEIFQHTASFKERGALNMLLSLSGAEKKHGVVAASAGNHAQGVAFHAARLGISATIVMPKDTPFTKIKRSEVFGATIVLHGKTFSEAMAEARRLEKQKNFTFIPTYDHPLIMAGQGTVAVEFLKRFPDLDTLIVPVGGGGLIAGCVVAAKAIKPGIKVYGVQSEVYPSMKAALEGRTIDPARQTIAEGIAIKEPGKLTAQVVEALVDDILIVPEHLIERAINMFIEVEKVVVEGAGAAPLAAVMQYPDLFRGQKTGLVLSGGNIDPKLLAYSLMRGLARDGRISRLRVTTPDLPGSLAKLTAIVAENGGNVIEVYHQRQFADIALKYTSIEMVIETKDAGHAKTIVTALEAQGFEVVTISLTEG
ncbi:MAG: threonine ammonia-lyase [Proteobacteria bacterium]|nr:threonine ammonia-lyase [Pseudomonadota bacterium]